MISRCGSSIEKLRLSEIIHRVYPMPDTRQQFNENKLRHMFPSRLDARAEYHYVAGVNFTESNRKNRGERTINGRTSRNNSFVIVVSTVPIAAEVTVRRCCRMFNTLAKIFARWPQIAPIIGDPRENRGLYLSPGELVGRVSSQDFLSSAPGFRRSAPRDS